MVEISPETKAVIWDLDGTLLNSFGIFKGLVTDIAPEFQMSVPGDEAFLANFHGTIQDTLTGLFGKMLNEDRIEDFAQRFLKEQDGKYAEVEGYLWEDALSLSARLTAAGIKQAIVTNRGHIGRGRASPRSIVGNSSLKEHIHDIICGDDTNKRKPDRLVLGDLPQRWGVSEAEVLVIGDQHVDAQLALNLGARAIIVARDGAELAHSDHLNDANWRDHITLVRSLHDVRIYQE